MEVTLQTSSSNLHKLTAHKNTAALLRQCIVIGDVPTSVKASAIHVPFPLQALFTFHLLPPTSRCLDLTKWARIPHLIQDHDDLGGGDQICP